MRPFPLTEWNAMKKIAKLIQQAQQRPYEHRYTLHIRPGMESLAEELIDEANSHSGNVEVMPDDLIDDTEAALESQQLDRKKELDAMNEVAQQIESTLPPVHHTGHVHHYLIDSAGITQGDAGSQATLKALVTAALNDGKEVVAALVSPSQDAQTLRPEDIAVSESLESLDITCVIGREQYVNYLRNS